ncbi:thromboxane-A synthase-like [Babylonia areolata]|uniref:thromboxane-A synthase-like n=1 Tax=Babylonia areolata TaxID=304850 RepID=UPI003FD39446
MMLLGVLLIVAVLLIYRYVRRHYQQLSLDGLPGPTPTPFIGNLAEFADTSQTPLDTFVRLSRKYGKVFGYYEGWCPSIVVSDPVMIEQILVKYFHYFDGRPNCWPFQQGAEQCALQNLNGGQWKRHREVIASFFRTSNIRQMWPRIQSAAARYVERLEGRMREHPEGFDFVEENETYSLEAFTSAVFDVSADVMDDAERQRFVRYMRATHYSASPENRAAAVARIYPWLVPLLQLTDTHHTQMAADFFRHVQHRLRQEHDKMQGGPGVPVNILQYLLSASKSRGQSSPPSPFTRHEIQGMVSGLIGGGLGPASTALDFCVHCAAVYPQHQDTLLTEISLLPYHSQDSPVTMEEVQGLQFLDMFVSECLRCFPVAPGVARTVQRECEVGGVRFRPGTVVRLMGSVQYADPELYPRPHHFDPYRFSPSERQKRHPYTYLPFGAGPRMCVARRLGLLQVKLALVHLLRRFKVTACPLTQCPLPLTFKPFLCPKQGVWVRLEPRVCP